jgi:hypothetical protein
MEKSPLKESISDIIIYEHYEQRFLDLEYIFQQDHSCSKISDFKNLELQANSQLTQKRHIVMNPAL